MKRMRTAVVVLVVTLLVWVFAENESLRQEPWDGRVRLDPAREDRLITPLGVGQDWDGSVRLTVEGSAAAIDRFKSLADGSIVLSAGAELPIVEGEHVVEMATALRQHAAVRTSGVSVLDADPPVLTLRVDRLTDREVPVVVEAQDAQFAGPATPSSATAVLRLPARLVETLPSDAQAVARLSAAAVASLSPGRLELVRGVRLSPPAVVAGEGGVSLTPQTVDVSVTVRSRTDSVLLPTVPVHVRLPAVELGRWDVRVSGDTVLRDVRVTGPGEAIARIQSNELPVVAVVPLTFEDLERGIESKPAVFSPLPTPLVFEAENSVVRLEIRRRPEADGDAGG